MATTIAALVFVLFPAFLLKNESRIRLIQWLSPAFFCYAGGIILGNLIDVPDVLTDQFTRITVVLAIPLLLLQTDLKKWIKLAPDTLIAYGLWIFIIFVSGWMVFYLMKDSLDAPAVMTGMATSVYIGGTQNMAAVGLALQAGEQLFIEMNIGDFLFCGVYLVFLLSFGQRILLMFLPPFKGAKEEKPTDENDSHFVPFMYLPFGQKLMKIIGSIGISAICVGLSIGLSFLISGERNELIIILSLTVLGLVASMNGKLRTWPGSYDTGEYLFLIFFFFLGAKIDLALLISGTPMILLYMALFAFFAITLHALLAYFFRIDADTVLIVSSAGIFGPPFIGPIANAMKNREIVASGITLGVVNMAVGNFMGILIYELLR